MPSSMLEGGICPTQMQEPSEEERERSEFKEVLGFRVGGGHCGKSKSVEAGKASNAEIQH